MVLRTRKKEHEVVDSELELEQPQQPQQFASLQIEDEDEEEEIRRRRRSQRSTAPPDRESGSQDHQHHHHPPNSNNNSNQQTTTTTRSKPNPQPQDDSKTMRGAQQQPGKRVPPNRDIGPLFGPNDGGAVAGDYEGSQDSNPASGAAGVKKHRLKSRFQVVRKLGQGTYGKVQLAVNKETGQEVR